MFERVMIYIIFCLMLAAGGTLSGGLFSLPGPSCFMQVILSLISLAMCCAGILLYWNVNCKENKR